MSICNAGALFETDLYPSAKIKKRGKEERSKKLKRITSSHCPSWGEAHLCMLYCLGSSGAAQKF